MVRGFDAWVAKPVDGRVAAMVAELIRPRAVPG